MTVFVMLYFSSEVDSFAAIASVSVVMEERGEDIVSSAVFLFVMFHHNDNLEHCLPR